MKYIILRLLNYTQSGIISLESRLISFIHKPETTKITKVICNKQKKKTKLEA